MTVRTADGDDVGTIESVQGNTARVKPEQNLSESIRNRLGWDETNQDDYELRQSAVGSIDDEAVHLKD